MSSAETTRQSVSPPTRSRGIDSEWLGIAAGLIALIGAAAAFLAAPLVIDESYSWVEQHVSESAGQEVDRAWLARTGFLLQGYAFTWIAFLRRQRWGQPATALLLVFTVGSFGAAAYSTQSWLPNTDYDATESILHDIVGAVSALAFVLGVIAVARRLHKISHRWRALDVVTVTAVIVIAVGQGLFESVSGALQRILIVIMYVWWGRELLLRDDASTEANHDQTPTATT